MNRRRSDHVRQIRLLIFGWRRSQLALAAVTNTADGSTLLFFVRVKGHVGECHYYGIDVTIRYNNVFRLFNSRQY